MSASSTVIRPKQGGAFPHLLAEGIHEVALGNGSQFRLAVFWPESGGLFCGIVGKGCYLFPHPPHPEYVREKMGVLEVDAENLADFIACQFGEAPQPFGHYNPRLCA